MNNGPHSLVTHLIEEPGREDNLQEVVHDERLPELKWLSILHELGAYDLHYESIGEAYTHGGQRPRHEEPVVDPRVAAVFHDVRVEVAHGFKDAFEAASPGGGAVHDECPGQHCLQEGNGKQRVG